MILCLGMTPALQRVMVFNNFAIDSVNRAVLTLDGPAGKSVNVAKILKTLGQDVVACGFFGGQRGQYILAELEKLGIKADFVQIQDTRQCVTLIDQNTLSHTELVEESPPVSPLACQQLFDVYLKHLNDHCRAVVLSGSLAPGAPADFYKQCLIQANAKSILTVVDAQKEPLLLSLDAKPGLVKPNRHELAMTLDQVLQDESDILLAMRNLCERGAQRVVATHGAQPTLAFDGKSFWRVFPPRIKPCNPIGSGDSANAAMIVRLLKGDDLGQAVRWGAAAGAANALTLMAAELDPATMETLARDTVVEKFSI